MFKVRNNYQVLSNETTDSAYTQVELDIYRDANDFFSSIGIRDKIVWRSPTMVTIRTFITPATITFILSIPDDKIIFKVVDIKPNLSYPSLDQTVDQTELINVLRKTDNIYLKTRTTV
jgi:hypothetical protein